jgi:hypothetical protein
VSLPAVAFTLFEDGSSSYNGVAPAKCIGSKKDPPKMAINVIPRSINIILLYPLISKTLAVLLRFFI